MNNMNNMSKKYKYIRMNKSDSRRTKKKTKVLQILSYNISWESMSGMKRSWELCSNNTNPKHPKHNSICVSNIANVINNNSCDFITLQEATNYKKLLNECPRLNKMQHREHNSGLDVVITFWDNKYKLIEYITGEFEKGRPWIAVVFSNGLCLINVHFGHYSSNEEYNHLEHIIKIILNKYIEKHIKTIINRIIIAGDFNYDIKDFGDKKGIITLNNYRFYYHPKHILTCCIYRRRHYDHIIDTSAAPIDIIIPDVEYMASDHKPIIATLTKN